MQSLETLDQQITLLVVSYVCLMKADVKCMRLCNVGGGNLCPDGNEQNGYEGKKPTTT